MCVCVCVCVRGLVSFTAHCNNSVVVSGFLLHKLLLNILRINSRSATFFRSVILLQRNLLVYPTLVYSSVILIISLVCVLFDRALTVGREMCVCVSGVSQGVDSLLNQSIPEEESEEIIDTYNSQQQRPVQSESGNNKSIKAHMYP